MIGNEFPATLGRLIKQEKGLDGMFKGKQKGFS